MLAGIAQVHALAFPGPQPTDPVALPRLDFEWVPLPTPGPDPNGNLFRRQVALPETYLLAPDNTCGFISASPSTNTPSSCCVLTPATNRAHQNPP
jgi:hypothetical protein